MSNLTFLTAEQCFGDNQLDIFKKRGNMAALTDFAILLGADADDYYIDNNSFLAIRTGYYWTKSDDLDTDVQTVNVYGNKDPIYVADRSIGARLALPLSSLNDIPMNEGSEIIKVNDGILEVEYGYYPQTAASIGMQEKLESAYKSGNITKTRNSYTTDSNQYNDNASFQPKIHQEYEYNGKRYVRAKANSCYNDDYLTLSNGEKYEDGDYVWVEVLPVKWLVDEESLMMITEKIIFAGVRFNDKSNYHTEDFDKTEIKKFMDEHLWRDMFQYQKNKRLLLLLKEKRTNTILILPKPAKKI